VHHPPQMVSSQDVVDMHAQTEIAFPVARLGEHEDSLLVVRVLSTKGQGQVWRQRRFTTKPNHLFLDHRLWQFMQVRFGNLPRPEHNVFRRKCYHRALHWPISFKKHRLPPGIFCCF
jgi:hypothetical protein